MGKQAKITLLNQQEAQTDVYLEQVEHGLFSLDKLHRDNNSLMREMSSEKKYHDLLRKKLEFLQTEYRHYLKENTQYNIELCENKKESTQLKEQYYHLKKQISKTQKSQQGIEQMVIKNNLPRLIREVSKGSDFPKEKSIVLNCLQELIKTTFDNEFSGIVWAARVAHRDNELAARIKFSNMTIHQSDINEVYAPVMTRFNRLFKHSGFKIKTKNNTVNGVIIELDFVIQVPFLIRERNLELP